MPRVSFLNGEKYYPEEPTTEPGDQTRKYSFLKGSRYYPEELKPAGVPVSNNAADVPTPTTSAVLSHENAPSTPEAQASKTSTSFVQRSHQVSADPALPAIARSIMPVMQSAPNQSPYPRMPTDYTNRRTDLPAPNPRRPVKRGTVQMMEDATRSFTTRSPGQQAPTSSTLQSTHPGFPHIHTDPMHHSQQTVGRPPYTGPYPFAGPDVAPAAFAHQIRPPDQVNIARYGPEALRPGGPSLGPAAMPFVNHPMGGPEAIQRTRQSRRSSTSNAGTSRKPQARRHDPMRENGVDEYASHSTETGNQLSQEELNNLAVQYKDRHSRQMGRKLAYQAKKDEVFCNFLP